MKSLIFIATLITTLIAQAGIDDFNQLINENKQEEQSLQQKLAKETGTPTSVETTKNRKELAELRREMTQAEAENVAVESSSLDRVSAPVNHNKKVDRLNMKRLSQEFKSSEK